MAISLGWAAKALILPYGGMGAFREGMPILLGLGDVVISCLWSILGLAPDAQSDYFFP